MLLVVDLPVPPSVNRIWRSRNVKGRVRVYKDPRYDRWLQEFWFYWNKNKPQNYTPIEGEFEAEILICPKYKRDADNSAKAVLDGAQTIGIIKNDSQARKVTQELVGKDRAPSGCRLKITTL